MHNFIGAQLLLTVCLKYVHSMFKLKHFYIKYCISYPILLPSSKSNPMISGSKFRVKKSPAAACVVFWSDERVKLPHNKTKCCSRYMF